MLVMLTLNVLQPPDWDTTHELYFGQRLVVDHELVWTREFHDKPPFVSMFYGLAGATQQFVWVQVMTLLAVLAAMMAVVRLAPGLGISARYPAKLQYAVRGFAAVLLPTVWVTLQGGMFNINVPATALALVALLVVMQPGIPALRYVLVGSVCAALAISMRPYHVAPLAVGVLWAGACFGFASSAGAAWRVRTARAMAVYVLWGGMIGLWGALFNVVPYVLTQQMPAFVDGLAMLAGGNIPNNGLRGFVAAMVDVKIAAFWLVFVGVAALVTVPFCRVGQVGRWVVLYLLCSVALATVILQVHS
ncbi:MAG: hypothetical protein H6922_02985 [Pseudomonadaceae bacterium]|nr:hypothetical protein [Pseudomonadaceae bacterium]